jgi:signal peptidase II
MTEPTTPVPERTVVLSNRRLTVAVAAIAGLVLIADQGSKLLAVHQLTGRGRVDLIGSLFGLQLTRNAGAAFSTATGATWVLTLIAIAVVLTIIRFARRLGSRGWTVALGLLLGGALGNLIDRLFRSPGFMRGHVVDFLEFPHWPIFNLADSCIVTAACLIALLSVLGIGIDGRRTPPSGAEASAEAGSTGSAVGR